MVSKASEDLPEPERPVMTTSLSRGMSTSMFLRLWTRAPRTAIQSCAIGPGVSAKSKTAILSPTCAIRASVGTRPAELPLPRQRQSTPVELTLAVTVEHVDQDSDDEPDAEPLPSVCRQPLHRIDARRCPGERDAPDEGHPEWPRALGFLVPQHQHADADDG